MLYGASYMKEKSDQGKTFARWSCRWVAGGDTNRFYIVAVHPVELSERLYYGLIIELRGPIAGIEGLAFDNLQEPSEAEAADPNLAPLQISLQAFTLRPSPSLPSQVLSTSSFFHCL